MFALDLLNQFQSYNGTLLAAGKIYVYKLGRTELAPVYGDHNGATVIANPVILDDQGMAEIYLNDAFNYTIVVFDAYGQEQFSRDIYPRGMGNGESIGTQLYEGIDPIVVNNDVYAISANTTKLGVQDPLYFVQDDSERVIIGFSGHTDVPEGTMNESAFGYEDGQITSYNGSAFSAGLNYEAGSYVDIDGNTINVTGLQPAGDYQSAGDYVVHDELSSYATQDWVENQSYMKEYMESAFYPSTSNPSGYLTAHQDLSEYAKTEDLTAYYPTSNPSGFINSAAISAMATTGFVAGVSADITALIPTDLFTKESADTLYQPIGNYQTAGNYVSASELTAYATTSLVSSVSSTITGMIPTGDFELVAGTNIELVDDAVNHTTTINMTADIPSTAGLATTAQLADVSADITAQIPTDLFTKASADTLYQPIGNYLSSNALEGYATENWVTGQGYITNDAITGKQDITGMTAYQAAGDYLTTADSAEFYTTANDSGFITNDAITGKQDITGMTAYMTTGDSAEFMTTAERSDYIPTGVSSEFYTTANTANYISEVPAGTMNESAFSYDASDNITAYNGSAFKAGDEFPQSATEAIETVTANSADWNGTTETVSSNSGAWGGSALPISAGQGVKISLQNDTLIFSNDETVLWTTADVNKTTAFTLSEPLTAFEKVRFEITGYTNVYAEDTHQTPSANDEEITTCFTYYCKSNDGNPLQMMMGAYTSTDGLNYGVVRSKFLYMSNDGTTWNGNTTDGPHIQKIVGINRIAGE